MKTIVEPKENIVKLWGKQRVREEDTYRMMRYVLRVEHDDKVLLHNVVTGELVELEQAEAEMVEKLPVAYSPVLEQLVTERFLVPDHFDEYKSVKQLRQICRARTGSNAINHYIILPTTFCNAHCFYCYESDYPRVHMTEETASRLIDYIDEHRQGKRVTINWFGGEPLVGIQRIDQISQGLKNRGIEFSSSMISNGYLFDEEIAGRAVDLWKLQRIQITLDGTEETYNQVKSYLNVQENPFQRVLRNIDLLSSKKIHVNIRLNVDFYNKDDICVLIEELGKRYAKNRYVTVYLSMLFNDEGFEPVKHTRDDILALSDLIDSYTDRLKELNLSFDNQRFLSLVFSQCMADNPHSVMVQPDGGFTRCEHESILDSYGSLTDGIVNPQRVQEWAKQTNLSDRCSECSVYPACYHLLHCMSNDIPCTAKIQQKMLKRQIERVRNLYVHKMEEMKNEKV